MTKSCFAGEAVVATFSPASLASWMAYLRWKSHKYKAWPVRNPLGKANSLADSSGTRPDEYPFASNFAVVLVRSRQAKSQVEGLAGGGVYSSIVRSHSILPIAVVATYMEWEPRQLEQE